MDNAIETYRSQLASNPDDLEALEALEAALLNGRDWQGLVELTAERTASLSEDEAKARWLRLAEGLDGYAGNVEDALSVSQLALAVGQVVEHRLGATEQALAYYENAVQLDATNVPALHAARRIHEAAESWAGVFQLLNLEVATVEGPQAQADIYFEMAAISRDRLERLSDTVACVRQALKLVPEHPKAEDFADLLSTVRDGRLSDVHALIEKAEASRDPRQRDQLKTEAASLWLEEAPEDEGIEALLRQVLAKNARNDGARILLEQYYETNGRIDDLVAWLTERAEAAARKADRVAIYQRLAALHTDAPESAATWHREVLAINGIEPESLNFCVDYYSSREEWLELVTVYELALRVRHRGRDESAMLVQIAMILWKKLDDLDAAETYFKRIKLNDPRNGLMLTFYGKFYRARGDHKRLLQTLTSQQQATEKPDARVRIGLEMAQVAENDLGNLQKAIDIYKSILKIDREHGPAREALRRLFTRASKWNALLEFLKEDLKLTQGAEARRVIYRQIIEIYRDRMKLSRMVIATWNQVLDESPGDDEALSALEEIYEQRSAWNDLIDVLQRRADGAAAAGDTEAQVKQLRRIATLWMEKFGNPTRAVESFEQIADIDPQDGEALARLVELYQRRKDWTALFNTYERQRPLLDGDAQVERLIEMAEIADSRLNDAGRAVTLWQTVLEEDPARDAARDALESLFIRHDHHEALVTLYRDRAERTDGDAQLPWLRKLARALTDTLADLDGAAEAWQQVLVLDPTDEEAEGFLRDLYLGRGDWERLERLFGGREKWAQYATLLHHAADATDERVARIDLLRRRAKVSAEHLDDEAESISAWAQILETDPSHLEAAQTLEPFYAQAADWDALVTVKQVILNHGPDDALAYMVGLAEVHATHRDDANQAWHWYAKALTKAPTRVDLLEAAAQTATQAGRESALADLLSTLVDAELETQDEVRIRRVLAEINAGALGRPEAAAADHERILALAGPDDASLKALQELYQQLGAWDNLLQVHDQRLARAETDAQRAEILGAIGALHEGPRDDLEAAAATFERLRVLDPSNLDALRGLQRLARQSADPAQLAVHLEAELALVDSPEDVARLHAQLGQIAEDGGDVDTALLAYAQALEAQPGHTDAFAALERQLDGPAALDAATLLEPHLRAADAWPGLRRVLALRAEGAEPAERIARLRERAEIEEARLDDSAAAFDTYKTLLAEAPDDATVRGHLERLAQAHDRFADVAAHYAQFAVGGGQASDPSLAAIYSERLAEIQDEHLRDPGASRATLETLSLERGDDLSTLAKIDGYAQRVQDWRGVAAICERRLTLLEAPKARIEVLFRLGALWGETLDDSAVAAQCWRRVLDEDANNAQALAALEGIFEREEKYDDLAALLMARIDDADGEARTALTFQLAQVLESHLENPHDALERYAAVLEADRDHEDATDAIEGLIIEHDEEGEIGLRGRACDVLEPIYRAREDASSLVHIAQVRLDDTTDPMRRAELNTEIAGLYESKLDDPQAAFALYGAALRETYGAPEIMSNLERLAASLSSWPQLAGYMRDGLEADVDPVLRREMLGRIAEIYVSKVKSPTDAIHFFRVILEDDADDAEALGALDTLYQETGDDAALVDVLARRIDLSVDVPHSIALSFRLGALFEQQPDTMARAIDVYARVRSDIDPTDLRAHAALERLYSRLNEHAALVEVLLDHAEQIEEPSEQIALLLRAAQHQEVGLEQAAQAVDTYRGVLEIDEAHADALQALDRLLGQLDRPIELLEVLEQEQALATTDAARNAFDLRIGALLRDALGEPERAVTAFKTVLDRDAQNNGAREALEGLLDDPTVRLDAGLLLAPLYTASEAWVPLRDTLRRVLDDRDSVDDQIASLERIAQLEETHLIDSAAAFEALSEAYRRSDGAARLEPELERLADSVAAHEGLADLYESRVDQAGERAEALYLKIANIAETKLNNPGRAIAQHVEVLAREPDYLGSLDALERLYGQAGDPVALVDVLERKTELTEGAAARKPLLARIAELQESLLDDPSAAIETWRRMLADDDADADALNELERLLAAGERWPELSALLEHRVSVAADDASRVEVEFRLAQVLERRLGEGARALDLYRQILSSDPSHARTHDAMAALFHDPEGTESLGIPHDAVAEILEPLYRADDDAANLAAVLEVQQAARGGRPDEQVRILRELVQLQEKALRNVDAAFDASGRVLQIMPEDAENRADLYRLAEQTARFDALAELLSNAAAETSDPDLRIELLLSLGQVEEQHRGQDDRAIEVYREVIAIDPERAQAVDALVDVFTRRAAWDELVRLHLDRAENADKSELRLALSFEACRIIEDVIADTDRAVEVYSGILAFEPTNERAFKALHGIFTREARPEALADLLRDRLDSVTEPANRAALRYELGDVLETQLDDLDGAIAAWHTVLMDDAPGHEESMDALERLMIELIDEEDTMSGPRRRRIAEILEPIYAESERWSDWILALEVRLEFQTDRWQRMETLTAIAKAHETKLSDEAAAFDAYRRAFEQDFGNADLQTELDRLAGSLGAWEALAGAYTHGIEDCDDPDVAAAIWMKVGRIRSTHLSQPSAAIEAWQQALLIDESNQTALDALEALLAEASDHAALVDVLRRKADLSDDPDAQQALRYRICGLLEEQLDAPAEAIDTYRAIFEDEPTERRAVDALVRLYRSTGDWTQLVIMMREQIELTDADDGKRDILAAIAEVQESELGDVEATIMTWRTVLELDAQDATGQAALERLLRTETRWGELIDLLEDRRDGAKGDSDAVIAIELKIADVLHTEMEQTEQAVDLYGEILERAPDADAARLALEALLDAPEHRLTVGRVLEPYYEGRNAHAALARIYELQLSELDDPIERLDLLKRLGALQRDVLGNAKAAFDAYGRALEADAADEAVLEALHALADDEGLHPELAQCFALRVQSVNDVPVAVDLNRRLARLYQQQLEVPAEAIKAWQAVIEDEPFDAEALAALDALYTAQENWPALIDVLQRRIEDGATPDLPDLQCKLGYLLQHVGGDVSAAIELHRAVLLDHPGHAESLRLMEELAANLEHRAAVADVLDPLYRDAGAWDRLALLTEMRIELVDAPRERAMLWMQSAELREEKLGLNASAFEALLQAFGDVPDDEEVRERLLRLGTAESLYAQLAVAFDAVQDRIADPEVQLEDQLRLAGWQRDELNNPAQATQHFQRALVLDPGNDAALDALEALYRDTGDSSALADVLRQRVDALFDLEAKRTRLLALGRLCEMDLGDIERAAEAYTEALDLDDADTDALDALEALYDRTQDYAALADILTRRAGVTYDEDALVAIHRRLGSICWQHLSLLPRAADAYERVRELASGDQEAIDALITLYTELESWDRLQDALLNDLTNNEDEPERGAAILLRLARNAEHNQERPHSAVDYYRQVLTLRPADHETMAALERLYRGSERWYDLVEAWRAHLEAIDDADAQVDLRIKIANVARAELYDADLAIECLNAVLDSQPEHGRALIALAQLHQQAGDWAQASTALERVAQTATEPADRAAAYLAMGELQRDHLNQPELARGAFERALELADLPAAADGLLVMARADGDDSKVVELLGRRLDALEGEAQLPVLQELATLYGRMGESAKAVTCLEAAHALAPDDLKISDALLDAYFAADRHADALPLLNSVIAMLKAARRNRDLFRYNYRLGCVAEAQGNDDAALAAYTACFEFDATYVPNLLRLAKMHYRREDWDPALKVYQTILLHQMKLDKSDRVDVFYHLGQVRVARGEERRAKNMFTRALSQDPNHEPSKQALAAL